MTASVTQSSGLRVGPPKPVLVFYYGEIYLGEVFGHPSDVEAARYKLADHIEMLNPGPQGNGLRSRLFNATQIRISLGGEYVAWPQRESTLYTKH